MSPQTTAKPWCGRGRGTALAIVFILFSFADTVHAGSGDTILGLWYNEERDALVEVFRCEEKYCGKIVWSREPNYPADDKRGRAGQPRVDDKNPDPNLRDRPISGLRIMKGFVYSTEDQQWKRGTIYDPKNGKTYRGNITLVSPDKLSLRGYVLFTLFGRSTTWTRQSR